MKKIFSILVVCAVAVTASAIPARRDGIVRTAIDGTEKTVFLHGDAFSHYMTDAEGNWLDEETLMPMSAEQREARQQQNAARLQARRIAQQKMVGNEPNIAPRGLLIMVNFADKAFVTPHDTIENMLNGDNYTRNYSYSYKYGGRTYTEKIKSSGSARQYFHDQSYGQYNPVFDVVGPYTLSQNIAYYGSNNDAKVGYMIKEACELADADGADFTLYDNDNDGKVDFVYVLYAGYGEADGAPANTVWPHNYALSYYGSKCACTVDGKKIDNYACSNEISYISDIYNGVGTFCHEFSHVLGLPDLYETNDDSNYKGLHTLLNWDILDYGPYNNDGNTPPAYSAYERFFMGWLTPRVLQEKDSGEVHLSPINNGNGESLLLCEGDQHNLVGYNPNPKTFYMLECRTKTGWDAYLPGKGMLITKVTYSAYDWTYNQVNNSATKMGVDLIEAKPNNTTGQNAVAKAYDAFPAGAKYWYGFENHEISEIAIETDGSIKFKYLGVNAQPIENVETQQTAQKILRDGKVLIIRGGKTFDLTGRLLDR